MTALAILLLIAASQPAPGVAMELWRLDCGRMNIPDLAYFSDSYEYEGVSGVADNPCFLIRHGEDFLLWDAGLPLDYLGNTERDEDGWLSTVQVSIVDQLAQIGLAASDIDFLAISHNHGDHVGQAPDFPAATLVMHEELQARIARVPGGNSHTRLAIWMAGEGAVRTYSGDLDIFGDGSVILLDLPGHTEGHAGLLVRFPDGRDVLISGDLFHFASEIGQGTVSRWNVSRPDTLASMARFERIVRSLSPLIIIQHDEAAAHLLPTFPESMH